MKVPVEHQFVYGELQFIMICPTCHNEVVLTNPWTEQECCGRTWFLQAVAVSHDDETPDDEE